MASGRLRKSHTPCWRTFLCSEMNFRQILFSETQRDRGKKRRARRHQLTSVAPVAARIRKRLAVHRHELPIIAARVQGELQDAVGVVVVDLSVLNRTLNLIVAPAPAGADHELTDALLGVPRATRVLRREALVVVVMGREDHVRSCVIESLPYGLHFGGVAVYPS